MNDNTTEEAKKMAKEKAEQAKKLAAEKLEQVKNISADEVKEMAKEKAEQAKKLAAEKLEQVKNISADEAKEMAKEKAEQAKKLAAEKLEQMKNISADEAKEMAKEKLENFKQIPKDKIIKYGAAAAVIGLLLYALSGSSSPEAKAQNVCEALKDGDYKEAVSYVPEKHREETLGLLMLFGGGQKNLDKMSNYDCSIKKTKMGKTGDRMEVYFEKAPKITMGKLDGEWYAKF